jgi:hypothetical protein
MKTAFIQILRSAVAAANTGAAVDTLCANLQVEADQIRRDLMNSQIVYSAIGMHDVSARKLFHKMQIEKRVKLKAIMKALTMMPSVSRPSKIKPNHIDILPKTKSEIFADFAKRNGQEFIEMKISKFEVENIRGLTMTSEVDIELP